MTGDGFVALRAHSSHRFDQSGRCLSCDAGMGGRAAADACPDVADPWEETDGDAV